MPEKIPAPQLLDQQRARYALTCVEHFKTNGLRSQGEIKAYVRRLPSMIRSNGFGQAMAFYQAKGKARSAQSQSYLAVFTLVSAWLTEPSKGHPNCVYRDKGELMRAIVDGSQLEYRIAEAETMALLGWAKKFVEALLSEETTTENQ